jgi:hypothetical protein
MVAGIHQIAPGDSAESGRGILAVLNGLYVSASAAQVKVHLSQRLHSRDFAGEPHRVAAAGTKRSNWWIVLHALEIG